MGALPPTGSCTISESVIRASSLLVACGIRNCVDGPTDTGPEAPAPIKYPYELVANRISTEYRSQYAKKTKHTAVANKHNGSDTGKTNNNNEKDPFEKIITNNQIKNATGIPK